MTKILVDKLVLEQVLEALNNMIAAQSNPARRDFPTIHDYGLSRRAADALRATLTQEQPKPVAKVPPRKFPEDNDD